MIHPEIARRDANQRYDQLLDAARAHRLAHKVSGENLAILHRIVRMQVPPRADEAAKETPALVEGAS